MNTGSELPPAVVPARIYCNTAKDTPCALAGAGVQKAKLCANEMAITSGYAVFTKYASKVLILARDDSRALHPLADYKKCHIRLKMTT